MQSHLPAPCGVICRLHVESFAGSMRSHLPAPCRDICRLHAESLAGSMQSLLPAPCGVICRLSCEPSSDPEQSYYTSCSNRRSHGMALPYSETSVGPSPPAFSSSLTRLVSVSEGFTTQRSSMAHGQHTSRMAYFAALSGVNSTQLPLRSLFGENNGRIMLPNANKRQHKHV